MILPNWHIIIPGNLDGHSWLQQEQQGRKTYDEETQTTKRAALVKAMNGIMSRNMMPSKSLCDELIGMDGEEHGEIASAAAELSAVLAAKRSQK